jgi:pyruvate-formate lyase
MVSERIQRMKDRNDVEVHPICVEKAEIVLDSWARNEGLPPVLRRAHMTADYLDSRTIFIEDDELIVGNVAAKPRGAEIHTVTPAWPDEDLENLTHGGGLSITEEEHKKIRELDKFWFNEDGTSKKRSFYEQQGRYYGPEDGDRLWNFIESGIMCPPWKDRDHGRGFGGAGWALGEAMGLSFFLPDYGKVISEGLDFTLQKAKKALKELTYTDGEAIHKHDYLQGCILVIEAMERMYYRYGDVAASMAETCDDAQRKAELERIADTCHWISKNGARDFKDAMQAFWFYFLMIATGTTGGGRFDQYMYPFYKNSIESGDMTDEDVLEYLEMLRCKIMQFFFVMGGAKQRQKWAGKARWHNFILGGCDREGKESSNELTFLMLKAAKEARMTQNTLTLRVSKDTPDEVMLAAVDLVSTGIGMPSFVSEDSYIRTLESYGVPTEDARDFVITGCVDMHLPGKSLCHAMGMFIVPKVLEITMNNGVLKENGKVIGPQTGKMEDFKSYDEFYNAFLTQMRYFMGLAAEEHNILCAISRDWLPDVVESAFADQGIESAADIGSRKLLLDNVSILNAVGTVNAADSLTAIKKVVFEDKACSIGELKAALDANWEGHEDLRKLCKDAPKYGNNIPEADATVTELYHFWRETASSFKNINGGEMMVSGISITAHAPGGGYTMATPDGRYDGDTLADGCASPAQGCDVRGPVSTFNSAMKIDIDEFLAFLMNMKISPTSLKTDEDKMKLANMIKTFLTNGGKQVQLNVIDRKTLEDAQKRPEKHKDLIVRVAGYSAYFNDLTDAVQDEIKERTEQVL